MIVYVLRRYWDTPDNEGNEIMGVYWNVKDAMLDMKVDAASTKAYYNPDFWEEDMTWENEQEIHLGSEKGSSLYATIFCWEIVAQEVQ